MLKKTKKKTSVKASSTAKKITVKRVKTGAAKRKDKKLLDKSKASFRTRAVALVVAISFVAWLVIGSVTTLKGCAETPLSQVDAVHQNVVSRLKEQLKQAPNNIALLTSLGNEYYDWGLGLLQKNKPERAKPHFKQAIAYYQQVLAIDPANPAVRTDMSNAYFYIGQTEQSLKELQKVIETTETFAPAWYNLGYRYFEKKDYNQALNAWNQYLQLEPQGYGVEQIKANITQILQTQKITGTSN